MKLKLIIGGSRLNAISLLEWFVLNIECNERSFVTSSMADRDALAFTILRKQLVESGSRLMDVILKRGFQDVYEPLFSTLDRCHFGSGYDMRFDTWPFQIDRADGEDEGCSDYLDELNLRAQRINRVVFLNEANTIRWDRLPEWITSAKGYVQNCALQDDAIFYWTIPSPEHIGPGYSLGNSWDWASLLDSVANDSTIVEVTNLGVDVYFLHSPSSFLSSPRAEQQTDLPSYYYRTWLWHLSSREHTSFEHTIAGWPSPDDSESNVILTMLNGSNI